eukprot:Gregarina_sp_Poly_1__3112@NODE_1876_length_3153_cov_184_290992_g1217_i0_p1_GENE_NODE_1876_length_3153_cov_184_290992_g1217_i0NODE_1876_length_3153_cov_184_290992_g1217_i0_p1_ORF_typecomplete_len510_score56_51Peptidase_C48/PF02902_19/9_3e37Peptidase_C57/PF03290_13/0_23Peptidase_C57/PF03290_13/4_5e03Peptidase_C5/PF00770_18/1_3Peptidase_C5/PF00770_18/7_1e02_NODE_1876_length_3153_cov_184_290992_g1217_i05472076
MPGGKKKSYLGCMGEGVLPALAPVLHRKRLLGRSEYPVTLVKRARQGPAWPEDTILMELLSASNIDHSGIALPHEDCGVHGQAPKSPDDEGDGHSVTPLATDISDSSDKESTPFPRSVPFVQIPQGISRARQSDSGLIAGSDILLPRARTCLPPQSGSLIDNSYFRDDKELYKREILARSNNASRQRSMFQSFNKKYQAFSERVRSSVGEQLRFRSFSYTKLIRSRPPHVFVNLTDADHALVNDTLNTATSEPLKVVAAVDGIELTKRDLACLLPGEWLNDEVMNAYMNLLNARTRFVLENRSSSGSGYCVNTYYWSTFFYASLTGETSLGRREYSYQRVRRWTSRKKIDIFAYDLLCIPLHIQKIHWALGAVDLKSKLVFFFDSLGNEPDPQFFPMVLQYLDDEHRDKKGTALPDRHAWLFGGNNYSHSRLIPAKLFSSFRILSSVDTTTTHVDIPQQSNGSDCGVFACQYAEALGAARFPFLFEAKDIPLRRKRMALEILRQKIMFY